MNVSRSITPDASGPTYMYQCPECGEGIVGIGDLTNPIKEMEAYNRWESDVTAHRAYHRNQQDPAAGDVETYNCPAGCGYTSFIAGVSDDPEEDFEITQQWHEQNALHEEIHQQDAEAAALASTPADDVVMPVAIHRQPRPGRPGNRLICPCGTSDWYPQSKHGSLQLLAFLDEHLGHSTVPAQTIAPPAESAPEVTDCD